MESTTDLENILITEDSGERTVGVQLAKVIFPSLLLTVQQCPGEWMPPKFPIAQIEVPVHGFHTRYGC